MFWKGLKIWTKNTLKNGRNITQLTDIISNATKQSDADQNEQGGSEDDEKS
jgi:hypothetical protein